MHILITGGAGYIGSVMSRWFLERGYEVSILDNFTSGEHEGAVPPGVTQVYRANVAEMAQVVGRSQAIEAIVHLGAFIQAGESVKRPDKYWQNNTVQSLAMLESMRALDIRTIVFASTAAVYGNPQILPITEEAATKPTNPYGASKLAIDMALTSYAQAYNFAATSLRFFNVAGAYDDAYEQHEPETHIIPLLLGVAAGKRAGFELYGDDYATADGSCIRDYIHVADLARAAERALKRTEFGVHAVYNLGNGDGFSNKQVIAAVERVTGKKIPFTIRPRREGDPAVLVASSQKARQELGWEPTKFSLDEMIADAWQHYEPNKGYALDR